MYYYDVLRRFDILQHHCCCATSVYECMCVCACTHIYILITTVYRYRVFHSRFRIPGLTWRTVRILSIVVLYWATQQQQQHSSVYYAPYRTEFTFRFARTTRVCLTHYRYPTVLPIFCFENRFENTDCCSDDKVACMLYSTLR